MALLKRHQEEAISGNSVKRFEQYAHTCKKENKELNDLPVEILFEILSRLPLTSLLQAAKCTCKLWNDIIKDSLFPELHVAHTLRNPGHLYSFTRYPHLYFAEKPHSDAIVGMKLRGDLGGDNYRNIQSSAGLICYHALKEKSIYICNPITRDRVKIPSENFGREVDFGFGYAPLSKKYKYFQVSHGLAAIFTLGDGFWRKLALPFSISNSPFYSDGALYWVASTVYCMDETEYQVVSLDLETETFRARRILPIGTNRNFKGCVAHLALLGETVAFVFISGMCNEVWTLMDVAKDTWVQKCCIRLPQPRDSAFGNFEYRLVGLWMNQELYGTELNYSDFFMASSTRAWYDMIHGRRLLSYNTDSETHSAICLPKNADASGDSPKLVIAHVGSLVSPSKIVAAAMKQPLFISN